MTRQRLWKEPQVMSSKKKPITTRVQIELPPKSMAELTELKSSLESSSYAEVLRKSLSLLHLIDREEKTGATFLIRHADGKLTELKFLL